MQTLLVWLEHDNRVGMLLCCVCSPHVSFPICVRYDIV